MIASKGLKSTVMCGAICLAPNPDGGLRFLKLILLLNVLTP